jgi:hypothetical protein
MSEIGFRWVAGLSNMRAIYDRCIEVIKHPIVGGVNATLTLVVQGRRPAHQTRRTLVGRNSPTGEIVADGDGNTQLVAFKAMDILAWMTAMKMCEAIIPESQGAS